MSKALLLFWLVSIPAVFGYYTIQGRREPPIVPWIPPTYDINLDLNYTGRWQQILTDFKAPLQEFIEALKFSPEIPWKLIGYLDYPIVEAYNKEFAEEVQVIANILGQPFAEMVLLNLVYDVRAQCTSIVIQGSAGNIFHARNFDFGFPPYIANLTLHGRYFKNGELLFEGISQAAFTGLATGMKPKAFSLSLNAYEIDKEKLSIWEKLEISVMQIVQATRGSISSPYLVRKAFETVSTYEELVELLHNTDTISCIFYIVGGVEAGQGTVITKYRTRVENMTTLDTGAGRWYVSVSNYEGDVPDPDYDDRATAARDFLNKIGWNNIAQDDLFHDVMTIYPVFNNYTILTAVMQASTGYINTTMWWGREPSEVAGGTKIVI